MTNYWLLPLKRPCFHALFSESPADDRRGSRRQFHTKRETARAESKKKISSSSAAFGIKLDVSEKLLENGILNEIKSKQLSFHVKYLL